MEMISFLAEYEKLPKKIQQQVLDYIEFLITKHKMEDPDFSEYYQRIQTVSQWSEEDIEYLKEIENNYNWKVEQW